MTYTALPAVGKIVAAASTALGVRLTAPVDLGGMDRSAVLRCRTADDTTVVVKAYAGTPEGLDCFAAEAAGLQFCDRGPGLLAVDLDVPLVVQPDLGAVPSLADALLSNSPTAAQDALLEWARTYGRLAAETAGRQQEWRALRERYARGVSAAAYRDWIAVLLADLPEALAVFGVEPPDGLQDDLDAVRALIDHDRFPVFSPGDICPDNNLLTEDGLRMIDFESAGYRPVFLDAAYSIMPFSSCWCVFRLPDDVAARSLGTYRAEVVAAYPELRDDAVWHDGVLRASAIWTLALTAPLAERSSIGDSPMHPSRVSPGKRQLLRYRWTSLADRLRQAGQLPAVAELMRRLLVRTERWEVAQLDEYPAFRSRRR